MYFLGGCTPKGGARALIGYVLGMIVSIAIMVGGGALGALGFWAMPVILLILVPIILYLDIAPEMISFVPAVFVGAGVFFGVYCVIGLVFGFITITFRGWYEKKYVNA